MISGLRRAGFVLLLVVLWELVARYGPWPPWIFPGPLATATSLGELARAGTLWPGIGRSLARLGIGYGISLLIGVPLGLLIGRNRWADEILGTPVLGLQALPSITWLPVALLWFGLSQTAILFVVVVGSVLAIAVASESGVRNLDPLWVRAALTLGSRGWRLYWTVLLPGSLPAVLAGAKLGWTFAWRSLMAAELLFVSGGLGQLLQTGRELNDVPQIFAVMAVITMIGFGTEKLLFGPAERAVRRRFGTERA
ncbi:MAG TPA: ABC transporter permease [Vulgatibacter sp.]|nr:ABC transporter permease [Vulgatibacter sp.]